MNEPLASIQFILVIHTKSFGILPLNLYFLQIKVDKNSFGEYKCTAKNRLGEEDMYFSLEQGSKPDRPEFLELRGANADLLDLGIHGPNLTNRTIPKGMEPNGFFVEYRPYKTMESWQNQEFDTSSGRYFNICLL